MNKMPLETIEAIQPVFRSYEATIEDVSKKERSIVAKINTGDIDRYKTVISPQGIDLRAYKENPCVLWEHGKDPQRGSLPIGRNQWIAISSTGNGQLKAKTLFGKDDYSQSLFEMYQDGTLRGWSVNILPDHKRCSPPTKEELRARPELSECSMMYRYGELAEYSGVAVPGNAETLSILAERGIWCPERTIESQETEACGTSAGHGMQVSSLAPTERLDSSHLRYIKHEGSKWNVYSESGKKLGSHDNEADAKKQLAAIEASKHGNSGRSVVQSNGMFKVVIGSHVILETPSRSVAEATLEAIDAPLRTWADEYMRLLSYQREWQAEMQRNASALLEMLTTGRV